MINNDWERFGDEIRRTIQNAVDSRDFSSLNQMVSDTIGQAMDNVSRGLKNGGWYRSKNEGKGPGTYKQAEDSHTEYGKEDCGQNKADTISGERTEKPQKKELYLKGTSTRIGGMFLAATGYVFGIGTFIFLIFVIISAFMSGWSLMFKITSVVFTVFTLIFIFMAASGTNMICSVGRFRKYIKVIKNREYCEVKELAGQTGRSAKGVVKDLRKMIKRGWFVQGHLDEKATCLMITDEAYNQYTALMGRMAREKAEREAAETKKEQEYNSLSPEVQKIVKAGDEYVKKIREANDAIPGEEISAKISRMEMLVDRIFDRVEQKPESVNDIRKLMEYYLPTTIKLLEAYEELDAQPVKGDNIITSKQEIEKTLDTLNTAFEKLLDDLFEDTAWDLSSDISVLQTMLAQEGLTEDGLTSKRRKKDEQ